MLNLSISLFSNCENKCSFCYNGLAGCTANDYFDFSIPEYVEKIKTLVGDSKDEVKLELIGGEIFSDKYSRENYLKLKELINATIAAGIKVKAVSFSSNLLMSPSTREKVIYTLKNLPVPASLATSLDFFGRFKTVKSVKRYAGNLTFFRDAGYLSCLSVILTKTAVRCITKGGDTELEKCITEQFYRMLLTGITVYFEFLRPMNESQKAEVVDSDDCFWVMKHLIKCGFERTISILENVLGYARKSKNCSGPYCILPGGKLATSCAKWCGEPDDPFNKKLEADAMKKYHCISCKYFNQCGFMCPRHEVLLNKSTHCWMKQLFEEYYGKII